MRWSRMCWPLLFCTASVHAVEPAPDATAYRDVLLAAVDLRDLAAHGSPWGSGDSAALRAAIVRAQPDQLTGLSPHLPPSAELQERIAHARARLQAGRIAASEPQHPAAKDIGFPEPDPISPCVDATAPTAHAMLEAWSVSSAILAAAKWACLQTEAGENASAVCTVLAVETESLQTEYELESFCLGAQRDASLAAIADTQQNVADFLNMRANVAASSRASQTSVDALQDTLDDVLMQLTELRATLANDDARVETGLGDILDAAMALAAQLTALAADIHDIRLRTQVVQSNIEDLQDRLADAQSEMARVATLSAQLRSTLMRLQPQIESADAALDGAIREQRDRDLAAALGDPARVVLRYRLPIANGGELERSREVLIRALIAYESLGTDTAGSRALLLSGDAFYNQGLVLDAYDDYARAYRLLLGAQTAVSNLIKRDSFE